MSDTFKFVQNQVTTVAGAGVSMGDTSITLTSLTQIDGTVLTMTDFGTIGFGTLEPGNGIQEEQIAFTGITQNSNGTATLTGVSSVLTVSPYTQTSGLSTSHAGGVQFVISNTAGFYDKLAGKTDDETITGTWTFTNPNYPRIDTATPPPTDDEQFAPKKYVDDIAIAGAPDATNTVKGITKLSVAAVSATDPISVGDNDTRVPTQSENDALAGTSGTPSSSNKYVTNDDTSATPVANKVVRFTGSAIVPGTGADYQSFTSSGTWTKPTTGITASSLIIVEMWGGGGGGGGTAASGVSSGGGAGGGGGAFTRDIFLASSVTGTVTVTIGTAGTAGAIATNGSAGGNTLFGSYATTYGGGGGGYADTSNNSGSGGSGGGAGSGGVTGDHNGAATTGGGIGGSSTLSSSGFAGGFGSATGGGSGGSSVYGGGGGSTAGAGGASYYAGGGGGGLTGAGGTSTYGGAGGAGGNGGNGVAGTAPGGGGGGGGTGTSKTGGAGAKGQAIIWTIR